MTRRDHWEAVFKTKASHQASWYQPHLQRSLSLIERSGVGTNSNIIDVGGGDSTLVQDLLERGFRAVTVLDISPTALARARDRLGETARGVTWIEADVTKAKLPPAEYDLWHDRAVFHFLTTPEDKRKYMDILTRCLRPSGYLVIATFGRDGPDHCSGLPTMRYGPEDLRTELGSSYALLEAETEMHVTPGGVQQSFVYCLFRMREVHTPPNNSLEHSLEPSAGRPGPRAKMVTRTAFESAVEWGGVNRVRPGGSLRPPSGQAARGRQAAT